MWTRKELKEKGKLCFKRNYWKCVLVALIISFIAGGSGGFSGGTGSSSFTSLGNRFSKNSKVESIEGDKDETGLIGEVEGETASDKGSDESEGIEFSVDADSPEELADQINEKLDNMEPSDKTAMIVSMVVVFIVVFLVVFVFVFAFSAFIINPIMVGCDRFFFKNLDEPANFSNIVHAFDHNYMNTVKTMFCKDIFTVLWSMLFIIPGIIKSYEYRMIPYILADNPDMDRKAVFALSKELMTGNKWKAFVLDLSFIGWELLSILTCGILSVFYVNPYIFSTNAALYEKLRYGNAAQ
ncbi:Protein of unknown function [Lachnospiraceae bacterium]|nr:Protein of unknown function [Lachnospiraceae bacterium]